MDAADVPLLDVSSPRSGERRSKKPWSRSSSSSSIGRSGGSIVEYTSLRDVLHLDDVSSPRSCGRRSMPRNRSNSSSSIGRSGGSTVEYTSLRDVLDEEGSGEHGWSAAAGMSWGEPYWHWCYRHDAGDFLDTGIRMNQPLKRATSSAYLQSSAAVVDYRARVLPRPALAAEEGAVARRPVVVAGPGSMMRRVVALVAGIRAW